jgi:serine/threonine protein phosphatase 1
MRSYAIGDIHGQLSLLRQAHKWIDHDKRQTDDRDAPVIHLGDLVDRGPDSAGVVRYLREGVEGGAPWVVLKGNHDRLFARFVADPDWSDPALRAGFTWLHDLIGGIATLLSYGVPESALRDLSDAQRAARDNVDPRDVAFLSDLPLHFARGRAFFVHAGLRPGVPVTAQVEQDLLWIRDPFLLDTRDHGALVVHGHTAIMRPLHYRNRLNIDSRAGYGGPLTVVVIEGRDVWSLSESGRVPILPL